MGLPSFNKNSIQEILDKKIPPHLYNDYGEGFLRYNRLMSEQEDEPKFPDMETVSAMPDEAKLGVFLKLPKDAQKFLVGASTFASPALDSIMRPVTELADEDYDKTRELLMSLGYVAETGDQRLPGYKFIGTNDVWREFVNGYLQKLWEEQKKKR